MYLGPAGQRTHKSHRQPAREQNTNSNLVEYGSRTNPHLKSHLRRDHGRGGGGVMEGPPASP